MIILSCNKHVPTKEDPYKKPWNTAYITCVDVSHQGVCSWHGGGFDVYYKDLKVNTWCSGYPMKIFRAVLPNESELYYLIEDYSGLNMSYTLDGGVTWNTRFVNKGSWMNFYRVGPGLQYAVTTNTYQGFVRGLGVSKLQPAEFPLQAGLYTFKDSVADLNGAESVTFPANDSTTIRIYRH